MGFITYGQLVGVFSEGYEARLDVGSAAMKQQIPATHESWATRLRIQRLDGPSTGDVEDTHVIGIFDENNSTRLDVGGASMKQQIPASSMGWGTQLKIWPYNNDKSKANSRVRYGDLIGVFDANDNLRLDIGGAACNPTPSSHNSWATRLRIQDSDPIVQVTAVHSMNYKLNQMKTLSKQNQGLYTIDIPNLTNSPQKANLGQTSTVTESRTWTTAIGFQTGVSVTAKVGAPVLGAGGGVTVSAQSTFNQTFGKTQTSTKTLTWKVLPVAQPQTILKVLVTVSLSTIEVPYEMDVDVKRLSGAYSRVKLGGIYTGRNAHDLKYSLESLQTNGTSVIAPAVVTPLPVA